MGLKHPAILIIGAAIAALFIGVMFTPSAISTRPNPPGSCSKTLADGGDLSTFLGTLVPGDVGCLHGSHTDGALVTWSTDATAVAPIVLMSYPGETAKIVGTTLDVQGDYLTIKDLLIMDIPGNDGVALSGNADRVEHNEITHTGYSDTAGGGVLIHTTATNDVVTRNYIHNEGPSGGTLYHGIYIGGGSGHVVTRNLIVDIVGGYGIQAYSAPSNIVIAENTVSHSYTRDGLVVYSTGGTIRVANNIFVNSTKLGSSGGFGMNLNSCGSGCVFDNNITYGNASGDCEGALCPGTNTRHVDPQFSDSVFHVAAGSPAVDTARADYAFFPDRDGIGGVLGLGPDLGAYER